ncbi:MAG: hypothetical protein ACMUEM_04835 [Flavobacteriales bacterium AspAUS03]
MVLTRTLTKKDTVRIIELTNIPALESFNLKHTEGQLPPREHPLLYAGDGLRMSSP